MHFNENCTLLIETALKDIVALGQNVLLLCNTCVGENKKENIAKLLQQLIPNKTGQILSIEKDFEELKQTLSEIKDYMKEKQDQAVQGKSNVESSLPQRKTLTAEGQNGIRIRGIPQLKEKDPRMRQEHDLSEVQKILAHLDVETEIGDIVRLGKYDENTRRTILLKVPNVWKRRLILSSARKTENI